MRGGNRPGAGRKPSGKRRIVMYGTLAEEHLLRDFLRKHRRQASTPTAVENEICHPKICPSCSKPMKVKNGSRGDFWGCSGYPECKYTESI